MEDSSRNSPSPGVDRRLSLHPSDLAEPRSPRHVGSEQASSFATGRLGTRRKCPEQDLVVRLVCFSFHSKGWRPSKPSVRTRASPGRRGWIFSLLGSLPVRPAEEESDLATLPYRVGHAAPESAHALMSAPKAACVPGAGSRSAPGCPAQPTNGSRDMCSKMASDRRLMLFSYRRARDARKLTAALSGPRDVASRRETIMRSAMPCSGNGEWEDVELVAALESLQRGTSVEGQGGPCGKG